MTESDPPSPGPHPPEDAAASGATVTAPAPSPAEERARRFNAANMARSLLPLVAIVLLIVGWNAFRTGGTDPVHQIDPGSTVQLAAARAGYPLLVPGHLPDGYRPTSARTDAGDAGEGDPVTLEIGYVTPSEGYAGFLVTDDPGADPLTAVLSGATEHGTVDVGGQAWTRSTTRRGETALSRVVGGVTVVVTGSAKESELETVAAAVRPYSG